MLLQHIGLLTHKFAQTRCLIFTAFLLAVFCTATAQSAAAQTPDGSLDQGFAPFVTGGQARVDAIAVQPDGKILIGGSFVQVGDLRRSNLARLNPQDGSPDTSFNAGGANGVVTQIVLLPDNKIIIGGFFTAYNEVARNGIARLNSDGSLDTSFNLASNAPIAVQTLVAQPDGKILVSAVPSFPLPPTTGQNVDFRQFNADGSLDTGFNPRVTGVRPEIATIAVQPNGKILIGGRFSGVNDQTRNNLARLNSDGSVDADFNVGGGANSNVNKILVQSDNKILVGGSFQNYNGATVNGLIRLNQDGALETVFPILVQGGTNFQINNLLVQPDNKILVTLNYSNADESFLDEFVRTNADGSLDSTFNPPNSFGRFLRSALALQTDGKIITNATTATFIGQTPVNLSRLDSSGNADTVFAPLIAGVGFVRDIALQTNEKIVIAGDFDRVDRVERNDLARLNANGSFDQTFVPATTAFLFIEKILVQPDNKILVGGFTFGFSNSNDPNGIARLNSDGSLDAAFQSSLAPGSSVSDIALQPDNKILLVGSFPAADNPGTTRSVIRLNADGTIDASFNAPTAESSIGAIALQADGKILIGGFASQAAPTAPTLRRLLPSGAVDASFSASSAILQASAIIVLPDNKILVGGTIRNDDNSSAGIARLNNDGTFDAQFGVNGRSSAASGANALAVQPDGKILFSGSVQTGGSGNGSSFIISSPTFGRLNQNGFRDNSFAGSNIFIADIALQPNGKIIVGGVFSLYNNVQRFSLARLENVLRQRSTAFDFDGDARADIAAFRPSEGNWYQLRSSSNNNSVVANWGLPIDKLAPADYDGDGKTDLAVWRDEPNNPNSANFYILNSRDNTVRIEQFGRTGDVPASGDWDGDGAADLAVYRPGAQSAFYYRPSSQPAVGFRSVEWGSNGDKLALGDFDADGKQDAAVFRPSNGVWYILQSSNNQPRFVQFGLSADKLAPADYDGDSKTDVAVFRSGVWYILNSTTNQPRYETFGLANDVPAPADYDGDGRADVAVYRSGEWYLQRSTAGFAGVQFGVNTDTPIPAAYLP